MEWEVSFQDDFEVEFDVLSEPAQDAVLAKAKLMSGIGPSLTRPHADTLNWSKNANMKELKCSAGDEVWRIGFDPERKAILLTACDKAGINQKRFYKKR